MKTYNSFLVEQQLINENSFRKLVESLRVTFTIKKTVSNNSSYFEAQIDMKEIHRKVKDRNTPEDYYDLEVTPKQFYKYLAEKSKFIIFYEKRGISHIGRVKSNDNIKEFAEIQIIKGGLTSEYLIVKIQALYDSENINSPPQKKSSGSTGGVKTVEIDWTLEVSYDKNNKKIIDYKPVQSGPYKKVKESYNSKYSNYSSPSFKVTSLIVSSKSYSDIEEIISEVNRELNGGKFAHSSVKKKYY